MILLKILIVVLMLGGGLLCIIKNDKWATMLQQYYVSQAKRLYGKSTNWERPWIRTLFRIIIIFAGVVLKEYTHIFKEGTDTVYWNKDTNIAVYTNQNGQISSAYKVTNENKVNTYRQRAAKQE